MGRLSQRAVLSTAPFSTRVFTYVNSSSSSGVSDTSPKMRPAAPCAAPCSVTNLAAKSGACDKEQEVIVDDAETEDPLIPILRGFGPPSGDRTACAACAG